MVWKRFIKMSSQTFWAIPPKLSYTQNMATCGILSVLILMQAVKLTSSEVYWFAPIEYPAPTLPLVKTVPLKITFGLPNEPIFD